MRENRFDAGLNANLDTGSVIVNCEISEISFTPKQSMI
jgi:hypothetical protein